MKKISLLFFVCFLLTAGCSKKSEDQSNNANWSISNLFSNKTPDCLSSKSKEAINNIMKGELDKQIANYQSVVDAGAPELIKMIMPFIDYIDRTEANHAINFEIDEIRTAAYKEDLDKYFCRAKLSAYSQGEKAGSLQINYTLEISDGKNVFAEIFTERKDGFDTLLDKVIHLYGSQMHSMQK